MKKTILAISILSIVGIGVFSNFYTKNEDSKPLDEPQIQKTKVEGKTEYKKDEAQHPEKAFESNLSQASKEKVHKFSKEEKEKIEKELDELYIKRKEAYIKRMKNREKQTTFDNLSEEDFLYTDYDTKQISPFEFNSNIPWNLSDDEDLSQTSDTYGVNIDNTNKVGIYIENIEKVIQGIDKKLIKEITLPTGNGENATFSNCKSHTKDGIFCYDNLGRTMAGNYNPKTQTFSTKFMGGAGLNYLKVINGKGYVFDVSNGTVEIIHDKH